MKLAATSMMTLFGIAFGVSAAMAQNNESEQGTSTGNDIYIQDNYSQEQGQVDGTQGVSSISVENDGTSTSEYSNSSSSWDDSGTEELRVYSGKQDGNNVIRVAKVKRPDGSDTSGDAYKPH